MIRVPGVIKAKARASLPLLAKTSLSTLMWFTNKCTHLKHNSLSLSLSGLTLSALKLLFLTE